MPTTAVHVLEIIQQVFRHATSRGLKLENPTERIKPSAIATFKLRDHRLSPDEISVFFRALASVGTLPTLRVAIKFVLLTLCSKGGVSWRADAAVIQGLGGEFQRRLGRLESAARPSAA